MKTSGLRKIFMIAMCLCTILCTTFQVCAASLYDSVKVGICGRMEPFIFVDGEGRPKGMYIDIMDEIARLSRVEPEYVIYDRQSEAVSALARGELEAVLGVLESDYASYPSLRATPEIYSAPICLVTSVESSGILKESYPGYKFSGAYELGTVKYIQVSQLGLKPVRIMATQAQLFESLTAGESDMIMAVSDCVRYMMTERGVQDDYVIALNYVTSVSYSVLLKRGDFMLFNTMSESIGRLRSSSAYDRIIDKWVVNTDLENAESKIRNLTNILGIVLGGGLIAVVMIAMFNRQLRKKVSEKTFELNGKVEDLENAYTLRNKLVEHAYAANLVVKVDGTVLLMNDVARRMENIPFEQADIPNIETMHIIGRAWELSPAEMDQPELLLMRDENGNRRTYRYQCHRTSVQDERVFIIEDVTSEEKEKQEIFEESKNKALNRIIAGIAHEIKNPLTTIRTYASLAGQHGEDPEFRSSFAEFVPKEADRINRMIETLIDYSRPPRVQKECLNVAAVVDDCLELAYLSSKKGINISSDMDRGLFIYASKEQLRQAFVNLVINSVESVEIKMNAAEIGGDRPKELSVRVSVYGLGSDAIIEVRDTGMGMDEEQIRHCMDPFFTTKKTGTGMGLAMTKMFIKENGGRMEVESVPGSFTLFRIIFREEVQ